MVNQSISQSLNQLCLMKVTFNSHDTDKLWHSDFRLNWNLDMTEKWCFLQSVTQATQKKNSTSPNRSQTYDLLVTSPDALPLSYRRLVRAKAIKTWLLLKLQIKCNKLIYMYLSQIPGDSGVLLLYDDQLAQSETLDWRDSQVQGCREGKVGAVLHHLSARRNQKMMVQLAVLITR